MQLTSSAFNHNSFIPEKYTCDGLDINPPLSISDTPKNTQSLLLIIDDPDSPAGTFIHWLLWNIDPQTTEILEKSIPNGAIEGLTSWGKIGYGGPCPNVGTHRYFFKIFALDFKINLPSPANVTKILPLIRNHILDQAQLTGKYSKRINL